MNGQRFWLLLPVISLFLSVACARGSNTVKIEGISPHTSQSLCVGSKVEIAVKVVYTLADASGDVGLAIQTAEVRSVESMKEPVSKGKGSVIFRTTFTVPEATAIQVFTPLWPADATQTDTVDRKDYKVVKAPC